MYRSRTVRVVDGHCAKRRRAQCYGRGPGNISRTVASNTKLRVKRRCCDKAPQINHSCIARSVANVIDVEDRDNSKAASSVDTLVTPVDMDDGVLVLLY